MTQTIVDAELAATKPGESSPFVVIPGDDLQSVKINEQIQDAMDSGEIVITNDDGSYSGDNRITTGDKLEFRVQLPGEGALQSRWSAIARDPSDVLMGGRRHRLELEATDFVFTVLSWRLAYDTFEGKPLAGSSNAIVDTLITSQAPEVGLGGVEAIAQETDGFYNGRDLLSIVTEDLAPKADAIVGQDGTDLVFKSLSDVTAKHPLTPSDFRGEIDIGRADDEIANLVRVDGGTDHDSDAEQSVQDGYERVTRTSRITTQVETRKSEVDRVLVHVRTDDTSADGITVRLQADRNGSPVDVDDQSSDIARKTLAKKFLADDGLTTFILPAHSLAPQAFPWLIIQSDGVDGHDIGVDTSTGEPTYRAEYPFPLLARIPDVSSQEEFRRRDHRIKDDSIGSFNGVRDKARSHLRHNAVPTASVSGEAETLRAHRLSPGEAVDLTGWGRVDISGTWICKSRKTAYDGASNRLSTTLTVQEARSL